MPIIASARLHLGTKAIRTWHCNNNYKILECYNFKVYDITVSCQFMGILEFP